jgi:hypothetical protein
MSSQGSIQAPAWPHVPPALTHGSKCLHLVMVVPLPCTNTPTLALCYRLNRDVTIGLRHTLTLNAGGDLDACDRALMLLCSYVILEAK